MSVNQQNIKFSDIYNIVTGKTHDGNESISLSDFRGKGSVPPTGAISIKTHFRGKSFGLYVFSEFTFETCNKTGRHGPTQADCYNFYDLGWPVHNDPRLKLLLNYDGGKLNPQGIQRWLVPQTGEYKFRVYGADATNRRGGTGDIIETRFRLNEGEIIKILVGQRPYPYNNKNGCGAGGTFVVRSPYNTLDSILVVAGGGGGGHNTYGNNIHKHGGGAVGAAGGNGTDNKYGGTHGLGGTPAQGSAGAGFKGDGTFYPYGGEDAKSFINGGVGGRGRHTWVPEGGPWYGGFGGGGGHGTTHGAGGGGINGGGGSSDDPWIGGGGGSYVGILHGPIGTSYEGVRGPFSEHSGGAGHIGNGKVEITRVPEWYSYADLIDKGASNTGLFFVPSDKFDSNRIIPYVDVQWSAHAGVRALNGHHIYAYDTWGGSLKGKYVGYVESVTDPGPDGGSRLNISGGDGNGGYDEIFFGNTIWGRSIFKGPNGP